MMPIERDSSQITLTVSGRAAPPELINELIDITVEESLLLPPTFVIRLRDPDLAWSDRALFTVGATVVIQAPHTDGASVPLLTGEITMISLEFTAQGPLMTVRGRDLRYRLMRDRKTRTFPDMSTTEIVHAIASAAGLEAQVDLTDDSAAQARQENQSDWEFTCAHLRQRGLTVALEGTTLHVRPASSPPARHRLSWSETLKQLRVYEQAGEEGVTAIVHGWDATHQEEFRAVAQSEGAASSRQLAIQQSVASQDAANVLAQSLLEDLVSVHVEVEGVATGMPELHPGALIQLAEGGARYRGDYMVTVVKHRFDGMTYSASFQASDQQEQTLLALEAARESAPPRSALRSHGGHTLTLDRDGGEVIRIQTANNRHVLLTDTDQGITISTDNHSINLDDQGRILALDSQGDLRIRAAGKLQIEARSGIQMKSGTTIDINAIATMLLRSNAALAIKSHTALKLESQANIQVRSDDAFNLDVGTMQIRSREMEMQALGNLRIQANALMDLKTNAVMSLQGSLVKIN